MPIRFRCAYCNQLLGIAKRKASTVIRCPTCAGQVIVPAMEAEEPAADANKGENLVFERNDFEDLLNDGGDKPIALENKPKLLTSSESPVAIAGGNEPPAGAWGTHAEPAYDVERLNPSALAVPTSLPAPAGIILSPAKATLAIVIFVVLLAVAFGGGVLVGYALKPAAESTGAHP